jgi:hypothetical protein
MTRRVVLACVLLVVAAATARAQANFRITHTVDRSHPDQIRISGWVYNEAPVDALDVSVTAEALDAKGKVVARGISFVTWSIPVRNGARFTLNVPAAPGITSFRVYVSSFRLGFGPQTS